MNVVSIDQRFLITHFFTLNIQNLQGCLKWLLGLLKNVVISL